jgi:hypothetical protein
VSSNGKLSLITLIVLAVALESMMFAQPAATATKLLCSDHELPVKLAPGETETFKVIGTLCSQGPATGKTVQLLLHGGALTDTTGTSRISPTIIHMFAPPPRRLSPPLDDRGPRAREALLGAKAPGQVL